MMARGNGVMGVLEVMRAKAGCNCGDTVGDDGNVVTAGQACEKHVGLDECACPEEANDPLALILSAFNEDGTSKEQVWTEYTYDKYGREHLVGCASIDVSIEPMLNDKGKQIGWQSKA